jgi:hypothetical protein
MRPPGRQVRGWALCRRRCKVVVAVEVVYFLTNVHFVLPAIYPSCYITPVSAVPASSLVWREEWSCHS